MLDVDVLREKGKNAMFVFRIAGPAVSFAVSASLYAQVAPQPTIPEQVDPRSIVQPATAIHEQPPQILPTAVPAVSIGMNFEGADLNDSGFRPPDTMGAIGPAHFVELINGTYAVYDRNSGTLVQMTSLDQFWTNAGATPQGNFSFDPRVVYDASTSRWFACAVDAGATTFSGILVAVSVSSNPTLGWTGFRIDADTDNQQWADFPTMGIDADALYVSANMFATGGGSFQLNFWVFPKADLVAGSIANMTAIEGLSINNVGFALQPVVDLDGSGLPAPILADFNTPAGVAVRSDVVGPLNSAGVTPGPLVGFVPFSSPPDADQPGPKQNINTGGNRLGSNVVLQGGFMWAVQSVNSGGRSAIRWLRIDPNTNTVVEEGVLSDLSLAFYYPSIAVNDFGNIVIGCSGSGAAQFVSAYAFAGQYDGVSTLFTTPILLRAGVSDYLLLDSSNRNRWGDYSATTLDPNNPRHFWTIQEFVAGADFWSTQITEIIFPAVACSPADLTTQGAGVGDPGFGVPDGLITAADINFYVNAWVTGSLAIADLTTQGAGVGDPLFGVPDGLITAADINFYVNMWVQGCP